MLCDAGTGKSTSITDSNITNSDGVNGTLTYIPSYILSGNSNSIVPIPPFTNNPHQIILQSSPVPLIDTLTPTIYSLPSGEVPLCYAWTGSYLFMGTQSGVVYYFDGSNWNYVLTFNGAVRCMYWFAPQGRLYFGGSFTDITAPFSQTGLNYVCWSNSFPSLTTIGVDTFSNYSVNGFDAPVYAITADNSFMYFGGEFNYTNGGGLNCKNLACYDWSSTQYIYTIDGNNGNGFDGNVWSLAIANQYLCVCGEFSNIYINSGSYNANYCICVYLNSGYSVGSYQFLYGSSNILTNPITTLDAVQTDGSTFYISTADSNIAGNANYMVQAPSYSFSATSSIGNNDYFVRQTSWNRNGGIVSYGISDSRYMINGASQATFPFSIYLYYNYFYNRQEFLDLNTGTIYIFGSNTSNLFQLQGGRVLKYSGADWFGGWTINTNSGNGYGFNATFLWNGSFYSPISIPYGNGY